MGAVRARTELLTDRPLTWVLLGGFAAALTGSAFLWVSTERRASVTA